uniref:Ribosomal protein S4 n=1 Tax=Gnetum montanum TaxID=3381 RepID=A0A8F4MEK6_9SPER|nr:ribosomal protein S4 [Gnetum montanum]
MPALKFKTLRLLSDNVWNKKLTRIQRRILRRLKSKRRYIRKNIYLRQNWNSYIKLQAIRKLSLSYGNAPITDMHDGGPERASHIPFPLNLETRLDVILVRLHFCETIPQARQLISHRKIRVHNEMVNITREKVSRGDLISIEENSVRTMGRKVRKYFYIEILVTKIAGAVFPFNLEKRRWKKNNKIIRLMWKKNKIIRLIIRLMRKKNKTKWFRLLTKPKGCRLLLKSWFLQQSRAASMQERSSMT